VLRVLYLVYTAGHAGRVDLAGEAIRLLVLGMRESSAPRPCDRCSSISVV
jgi:hypothetical protein